MKVRLVLYSKGVFALNRRVRAKPTQRASSHANSQQQRKVTGECPVNGYIFPVPESGPIRSLTSSPRKCISALISFFPSLTLNPIRGDQLVHQEAVLGKNLGGTFNLLIIAASASCKKLSRDAVWRGMQNKALNGLARQPIYRRKLPMQIS